MDQIKQRVEEILEGAEKKLAPEFAAIDRIALHNQEKVLDAFWAEQVGLRHFAGTTGYGYDDIGRDTLNRIFARVLRTEDALVSSHILSGTHAISTAFFGVLRPGDLLLSLTGAPYDTLAEIIDKEGSGSLRDFGIRFGQVDLLADGEIDREGIRQALTERKPRMVFVQRSRGYAARNPLSIRKIREIFDLARTYAPESVVLVDNCYGEFTEEEEVGVCCDLCAGSLIKNPGGGLAPSGGYIAGKKELVELCANRLTTPSTGAEIGSNAGGYQYYYQGLFMAPHVTAQSLKGALLIGETLKAMGYCLVPETQADCFDIIRAVQFPTAEELIEFCREIQKASPVDGYVTPYPWDMPGYTDQVIMAAGCFVQGSSIELSCDAPIRPPYVAYIQGGLTYEHVRIALSRCCRKLLAMR